MERMDQNMPFLLKYENVAWYENGKVRILDRRVFPTEVRFVECESYREVAQAIALRKLSHWGVSIDTLTPEQQKYLFG